MSAVRFENEIHWDGNSISVWANLNGSRIFCEIPRSTINGDLPKSPLLTIGSLLPIGWHKITFNN
jgi:hypothetical protein